MAMSFSFISNSTSVLIMMFKSQSLLFFFQFAGWVSALPTAPNLADSSVGPQPDESSYYSDYTGTVDAFPANTTNTTILQTTNGAPGPDDLLFQNLLSAEWVIYSFYQQGVEKFNTTSFTSLGYPNTTYDRITEIRDNEAGHLRIFQDQISSSSITPGRCEYNFGFIDATSYLATLTTLEISSMAFLTGLILDARLSVSKAALVAIAETESRHNTWSLIDIWNTNPFAGPSDTIFPYANQILDITNLFVVPGSCPPQNPEYPYPNQKLPTLSYSKSSAGVPGSNITFTFPNPANQPSFDTSKEYYAVSFHGLNNFSFPFDTNTNGSSIPQDIEPGKGLIIVVLADEIGAPSLESVVAGPALLVQQPYLVSVAPL
jgi:hypothetical protein